MTKILKVFVQNMLLRRRFPRSVINNGAFADRASVLGDFSVLFRDATLVQSDLGAYSYVQSGSLICNAEIGKYCSIAGDVSIGLASHPTHFVSSSPVFYDNSQPLPKFFVSGRKYLESVPRTIIGADVWIGQGVMIKAGIKIGVGAVIGAGSIVTKDVAPYVIAAGNPCKIIRHRFSEEVVNRLLDSHWWQLSDKRLEKLAHLFLDPLRFLDELEHSRC
ncbi:MAG: CatB-related O-acetyltransferase [Rhodoferax sp.]|nr:CatB-related O-acetyltransferase [Rhodoferax sp.]MDP3651344.1 CatB-related O-acetyltransferase [Rhodoferax sp.]